MPESGPRGARRGGSKRPEAIFFDLFHTLVDVNSAPGMSSSEIMGLDPTVWNQKLMRDAHHHALGTEKDPYESVRKIAHSIDSSLSEEKIRAAVEVRPNRFRHALINIRPEILTGLEQLRGMGLRCGLISNAGLDEVTAWRESPLAPFFETTLFSCHVGLMKPDPRMYLLAAERLSVSPARCWFVGDGGSDEHRGAREAGMTTVLILGLLEESLPEVAAARSRDTDYVIGTLEDLVGILGAV